MFWTELFWASIGFDKKETRLRRGNRVPKTNYGKSNVAVIKIKRGIGIFFRYGLDEI